MATHTAPSILNTDYRRSWIQDWSQHGERGQRWIASAIEDLERMAAVDRAYGRADADLAAALIDLRAARVG